MSEATTKCSVEEHFVLFPDGRNERRGFLEDAEALIFDCDGTLVDSMPMWLENWRVTCAHFNIPMTDQDFHRHAGRPIEEMLRNLCKEQNMEVDPTAFFAEKAVRLLPLLPLVREIDSVTRIARAAAAAGVPMAVVSSGPRDMVLALMRNCNLHGLFEGSILICAEDVTRHKPHPEPFLQVAERLGLPPARCRVFEDADAGLTSARAAGMQLVDVRLLPGYPALPN